MIKTQTKTRVFDVVNYLDSDEARAEYVLAAFEEARATGDHDFFLTALNDAARAKGMTRIARDSGIGRESLYRALSPGHKPYFLTVCKVLGAIGIEIDFKPITRRTRRAAGRRNARRALVEA